MSPRIVHLGDPMPLPRARARIATGKNGEQWIQHYTPAEATKRMDEIAALWRHEPYEAGVPLTVEIVCAFARPAGHFAAAGHVKPQFITTRPGKGGSKNAEGHRCGADLDNVVKLCLDALNGTALADDGQVAEIRADKFYVDQAGVAEPQTVLEIAVVETAGVLLEAVA